jgi:pimeloyl-[acyl-carrier protein] methyl ester esterase
MNSRVAHGDLPALVLLPGMDGTGKLFTEFLKVLDPDFNATIIAYPKDAPASYAELEVLVRAALPADRPFVLLGESFSGPIAIRIAATPPKGLMGLILCATFASNPFPYLAWARPLAAYLPLKYLPRWARAPLMWGSASPRRAPRQSERAMASVSAVVIRHRIAALLAVDESAALRKIAIPTLVLRATQDRVVSIGATQGIMHGILHAQLVDIDGPHLLMQTRAAECAAAVHAFAAQLKEPGRPMPTR